MVSTVRMLAPSKFSQSPQPSCWQPFDCPSRQLLSVNQVSSSITCIDDANSHEIKLDFGFIKANFKETLVSMSNIKIDKTHIHRFNLIALVFALHHSLVYVLSIHI